MIKPLFIITWLLLLGAVELASAQEKGDHLEPVGGIFDIYNFQFDYYSKVRKKLFQDLTDSPEIRFQVMPSFTPESVLDIEFDRTKNKHFIIYHIVEEMIWYNEDWENVRVKKYRTEIDNESVEKIKALFEAAISLTKFPDEEIIGNDGVNYYFTVNMFGLRSGTIWTPANGTKMRRLCEIGYSLTELAKSNELKVRLDEKLKLEIKILTEELK